MDRIIKETFQIKHYIRYMDDLIMIIIEKKSADKIMKKIKNYLYRELLIINPKSQVLPLKNGISFLGWTFTFGQNGAIVQKPKKSSKARIIAKIKDKIYLYKQNIVSKEKLEATQISYLAHLKYGNNYYFLGKILNIFFK